MTSSASQLAVPAPNSAPSAFEGSIGMFCSLG
jgi:hypothetical protein